MNIDSVGGPMHDKPVSGAGKRASEAGDSASFAKDFGSAKMKMDGAGKSAPEAPKEPLGKEDLESEMQALKALLNIRPDLHRIRPKTEKMIALGDSASDAVAKILEDERNQGMSQL